MTRLAGVFHRVQGVDGFGQGYVRIRPVDQQQIDLIDAEPAQAGIRGKL